jgi:hypothetical protein
MSELARKMHNLENEIVQPMFRGFNESNLGGFDIRNFCPIISFRAAK